MKLLPLYIFNKWIRMFFLILFSFYFVYSLIDYSFHFSDLFQETGFYSILKYYLILFVKRAKIFFPLATLLSTIHLFCDLNRAKELVAFQAGGIKLKQLVLPVIICSLGCVGLNLVLNEWVLPASMPLVKAMPHKKKMKRLRKEKQTALFSIVLQDDSKIVYKKYDRQTQTFFQVFWLKNPNEVWKIKRLEVGAETPIAVYAEHIVRNEEGFVEKREEYERGELPDLVWKRKSQQEKRGLPQQGLSTLWKKYHQCPKENALEKGEILTQLILKLVMPFFSLLVVFAVFPSCIVYRREIPYFLIYALAIFGFVACIMFFDATTILAEHQCLSPYTAILLPFIGLFAIFGWRFAKACKGSF